VNVRTIHIGSTLVPLPEDPAARLFVLLGQPVAHSQSPRMQAAAFADACIPASYVACDVAPHELAGAIATLRGLSSLWGGANVTLPHKHAACHHVDELGPSAARAGAVNTFCAAADGRRWIGHNTDVDGVVAALAAFGTSFAKRRITVLGAGGMARAVVAAALQQDAASIALACRDVNRGVALLDELERRSGRRAPSLRCTNWSAAEALVAEAQVLVHATPLGLAPGDPSPVDLARARSDLIVVEAAYGVAPTGLESAARSRALRVVSGRELLVQQGAAAFALWTGHTPPVEVMRHALGLEPPR